MLTGYYLKNKENFKNCSWRYENFSEEEKNRNQKYGRQQYRNFSEEEKTKSLNMLVKDVEIFQIDDEKRNSWV